MKTIKAIEYFDRYNQKIVSEPIYASSFLNWAYNTKIGLLLTKILFSQKIISKFYGWINKTRWSTKRIETFVKKMKVDLDEMLSPIDHFKNFNEFFIRKIDLARRPVNNRPDICVAPADGRILVYPNIKSEEEFCIKRNKFNLKEFLRNNELVKRYSGGSMLISRLYLTDYHHFHFPDSGIPSNHQSIKGKYFTSSSYSKKSIIPFFSENYRMCTEFNSVHFGQMVMVEIGAFTVGSIKQLFIPGIKVCRGDHKGYFEIGGSTIVLLFKKGKIEFDQDLIEKSKSKIETYVKMGDSIGRIREYYEPKGR